jgi:hypothetical protein
MQNQAPYHHFLLPAHNSGSQDEARRLLSEQGRDFRDTVLRQPGIKHEL